MKTLNDYGRSWHGKTDAEEAFPKYIGKEILVKKWLIGGKAGGNCWTGQKDMYSIDADPEPYFEELDLFLELYYPKLSFLQYKKIERELIHEYEYTETEYYGNSKQYMMKFIVVEELENLIKEFKFD